MLTTLLGGRAFAERYGEPPPQVVALHGWARNRSDWDAALGDRDALALDLPGFGDTAAPESGWSTEEYAAWLGECLDDLARYGGHRPVLVGHGFGGRVAVQLAAAHPELVRGLVLTGVPLLRAQTARGRPPAGFRAMRFLNDWHFISNERMEQERRKRGSADYLAVQGVLREVLVKAVNEDHSTQLDLLAVNGLPVTMVWGERDTAAPPAMAEQARARIGASAGLVVVPGAGHQLDAALAAPLRTAVDAMVARP